MTLQATRIIAVRHGETDWNVATRLQGHLDIELNATGRSQAQRLAQALAHEPISAIYSSDLLRAWDTARAISGATGQTVHAHCGLRERSFGVFQGNTHAEVDATWPEQSRHWRQRDPHWAPEGGESLLAVHQRITQATSELAAQHLGQQIVLVAHGGVLDVLYRVATGQELHAPRTWKLGHAAINRLLWTPDGLTLVDWSDTRHLEDAALDETTA